MAAFVVAMPRSVAPDLRSAPSQRISYSLRLRATARAALSVRK